MLPASLLDEHVIVMINVAPPSMPQTSDLVGLVSENVDDLVSYATHLVGNSQAAVGFVAGGVQHAAKYPPTRLRDDGGAALYRAVTRACRQQQTYPPRPTGLTRYFKRSKPAFSAELVGREQATRMNTVKRALMSVSFDRRAALLLRDMAKLSYREMAIALECSPESAARLVAAARRDYGTIYRDIAL